MQLVNRAGGVLALCWRAAFHIQFIRLTTLVGVGTALQSVEASAVGPAKPIRSAAGAAKPKGKDALLTICSTAVRKPRHEGLWLANQRQLMARQIRCRATAGVVSMARV